MREIITISLSPPMRKQLDRMMKAGHVNRSDVVREALRQYFSAQEFRRLRKLSIPHAEKKGFTTDEDIFENVS